MYLCHKKEDFLHDLIWPWPSNIIQGYVLPTLWSTVLFDWNMSQIGPKGENVCSGQEFFPLLSFTFDLETWSEKFEALIRPVDLKIELVYTVKDGNFFFTFRQNSIQQIWLPSVDNVISYKAYLSKSGLALSPDKSYIMNQS